MSPGAIDVQPMPFRRLVDDAMTYTRAQFRVVYLSIAAPLAIVAVLVALAQLSWMSQLAGKSTAGPGISPWSASTCAGYLGGALITVLVEMVAYGALTVACTDIVEGRPVDMARSWRFIVRGRSLGTLLASGVVIALATLLFLFPGIYVGLMLSFVVPIMASEGRFGREALKRSAELTRYNPRRRFLDNPMTKMFLFLLVAGVISYAARMLVALPLTLLQGLLIARGALAGGAEDPALVMRGLLWIQIPTQLLSSLASSAVGVYTGFGVALLYVDSRRRREATDLEHAIDVLTARGLDPGAPSGGPRP
jgi:hypothetical protein